ncbi:MAG: hypothetical protein LUM44_03875 [Pyrinomonadaceae bacterium]|nr:hypothetical protein [Pyrinomonadaceae bacterium]
MQNAKQLEISNPKLSSAHLFALGFLAFCVLSALLIGSAPITASIVTIFLFAGIHNFFEFRYFAARMPVRWGRSRLFYTVGIGGVLVLTAFYLTIYFDSGTWLWSADRWQIFVSGWNTAFILWLGTLFYIRGRQKPKSDWTIAFAVAFLLAGLAWLFPAYWSLSMVYLHPFVAMWFLERQIRRTKKEWLKAYHFCLLTIPFFIAGLYFAFANAPNLAEENSLFSRITQHAGSGIFQNLSSHFLVATHVFLETIHYTVWILLIPLVDKRAIPWKLKEIPLFANKDGFPKLVAIALLISLSLVFVFWFAFSRDYETTRDIYFAFAMAHVLAEMPFLVKML